MGPAEVPATAAILIDGLFAFGRLLDHAIVMGMHMVAEVLRCRPLLIQAIVRCHRPTELQRQHDQHDDGNPTTHGLEMSWFREVCARSDATAITWPPI